MRDFSLVEKRTARAVLRHLNNRAVIAVGGITLANGGIFDAQYTDVLDIDTVGPAVKVYTADVTHAAYNMAVVLNGTEAYKVAQIQPDGTGLTVLRLHKA